MTNNVNVAQYSAKYKQARSFLLMIVLFSAINLVSVAFLDTYFLFSSYVTQIIAFIGAGLYAETGMALYPVICGIIGLISVLPYLLCYIFSKKKNGWMIAAMILFSVDSLLFYFDFLLTLAAGGVLGMLTDALIRALALFYLIYGVINGQKLKKAESDAFYTPAPVDENGMPYDPTANAVRRITVKRQKKYSGSAVAITCYVDDKQVCVLKNGEEKTVDLNDDPHSLVFLFPGASASTPVSIPAGYTGGAYEVRVKMGAFTPSLVVNELPTQEPLT